MSQYTVLLDANILYPAPLRDIFLQLAVDDVFQARWTADIHREWIEALLRRDPHRQRERLERTRELMDASTRDALITGYETLIPCLSLPDPDDQHVLAAAIVGRCDAIITINLSDFPISNIHSFGIEVLHPDEFLHQQLDLSPDVFCTAIRTVRKRLKNPPYSVDDYLGTLAQQGLTATVSELKQFSDVL